MKYRIIFLLLLAGIWSTESLLPVNCCGMEVESCCLSNTQSSIPDFQFTTDACCCSENVTTPETPVILSANDFQKLVPCQALAQENFIFSATDTYFKPAYLIKECWNISLSLWKLYRNFRN